MNLAVTHRGPDGSGVSLMGPVGLGHTRLAIIDANERSSQPMISAGHRLTFNGEIYNYIELRQELASLGSRFETTSDTEVLLAALQQWGLSALDRLNGMFAFIWHNEAERSVYLVRDRFGKKPLVYAQTGKTFAAGSEAKQLLAAGAARTTANVEAVVDFLATGALNQGVRTFFEDIVELPAGHFARLDLTSGRASVRRWYDLASKVHAVKATYPDARDRVRELLLQSVRRRHRADVAVGACLSGGIDSSVIVALSADLHRAEPLTTISAFGHEEGYDERRFSRCVASKFGVKTLEIEVETENVWRASTLEEIGRYQDQPIPSGSHYNEYAVYRTAREAGLIVMLGGQGADEYFGGYGEFWFSAQAENLRRLNILGFREGIRARAESTGRPASIIVRDFALSSLRRSPSPASRLGPHAARWLRASPRPKQRTPNNFRALSISELQKTSIPYQVHSEDRSSMRWSVESRMPFLDHELVEYVLGLPTDFKVGAGYGKRILRDAAPELPAPIARRKDKIGFASPDSHRLRSEVSGVRRQLQDTVAFLGDLVDGQVLLKAFDEMTDGAKWYDPLFFRLVSLGAWARAVNATL